MRRRRLLLAVTGLAVVLTGAQIVTNCGGTLMTLIDAEKLRARYERNPREMLGAAGWTLTWSRIGGEPDRWLSDKLDLTAAGEQVTGRYARGLSTSALGWEGVEEFAAPVPPELVERVFRALFAVHLFERHLPMEKGTVGRVGDAVLQTFELNYGSVHLVAKTHFAPPRDGLGDLGPACYALTDHLRANGVRRVVDSGVARVAPGAPPR
jgi:hypothetical protein